MSGGIGNFIVTLPENMDISSDDEDFLLANLELFELQPIGASSVGEYEQMQRNLQADNPTLAPQIDSRKPANQEILQPVPERSIQQTDPSPPPQNYVQPSSDSAQQLDEVPQQLDEGSANMPEPKRFKSMNETELKNLQLKTITTNRRPLNKTQDGELNYSKVCYILHFAHTNKNTMVTQFCMILIWIFVHQNRNK